MSYSFCADEFGEKARSEILFPMHIHYFKSFESGLFRQVFPSDLIFHQLGIDNGLQIQIARLKGEDYADDEGFILSLIVDSLGFKLQQFLN
jgi:hypothetical protein